MKTLATKSVIEHLNHMKSKQETEPLKKGIEFLVNSSPSDVLRSKKTQKLILPGKFKVYSYRVNADRHIFFSIENMDGEKTLVIHSIE